MIGIYIIIPLLRPIVANKKLLKYFLLLSFITSILLPTIRLIPVVGQLIFNYSQRYEINMVLGYVFYFVLGYYLSTIKIPKKGANKGLFLTIAMTFITAFLTGYLSKIKGELDDVLYAKLLLNNMLAGIGVFCFIQSKEQFFKNYHTLAKYLPQMPMYTLGVYAMHPLVLDILYKTGIFEIMKK